MKKRIIVAIFMILINIVMIMPQVNANEMENYSKVIGKITEESKTVEQNKSVFVEMNIDNIENVKTITGYIASTTNAEQYITVELKSTTQGKWYYFDMPSTVTVGQTYIMPKVKVVFKDGTTITGKATGEFKVIQEETEDYSKVIGSITEESKTVEQNKSVFVEMNIDNIENVKTITGYIASTTNAEQYITVELKSTTQGKWYYFDMPSTVTVGQTYIMPKIQVIYQDKTTITGKVTGEVKVIKNDKKTNMVGNNTSVNNKTLLENKTGDNTISKETLPKAGKNAVIILIVGILVMILIITIIKSKKLEF